MARSLVSQARWRDFHGNWVRSNWDIAWWVSKGRYDKAGQCIERLQNCITKGGVAGVPLSIKFPISRPLHENQKGGCLKSGRSSAVKSDRLGLSCKANKCSGAGTRDLGVLTTHETSCQNRPVRFETTGKTFSVFCMVVKPAQMLH